MTKEETAERLIEIIRDHGLKARSYSGRGMYGAECVGVDVDSAGEVMCLARDMEDSFGKVLEPTFDNMGLGLIAYWPRVRWPDDLEDDE